MQSPDELDLVPGAVICMFLDLNPKPKDKFIVVLEVKPDQVTGLIVNSEINDFKQRREAALRAQLPMTKAEHPFMDHDSFVDCYKLHRYTRKEVERQLVADSSRLVGLISGPLRASIVTELRLSGTILPAYSLPAIKALTGA